jgi:hypothetical protein
VGVSSTVKRGLKRGLYGQPVNIIRYLLWAKEDVSKLSSAYAIAIGDAGFDGLRPSSRMSCGINLAITMYLIAGVKMH